MEIEIIYEKGAFRPLKKEYLKEGTRLTFIIEKNGRYKEKFQAKMEWTSDNLLTEQNTLQEKNKRYMTIQRNAE